MCGIGGVYVFGGEVLGEQDAKKVKKLTVYLEKRGDDATGWYDGKKIIKAPLPAHEFIQLIESITPIENYISGKRMLLIHTRAYTRGSPLQNKNNHPFELKSIVFAHNGVINTAPIYKDIRLRKKENQNKIKKKNEKIYHYYSEETEYIDTKEILGKVTFDLPETDSFHIGIQIQKQINEGKNFKDALVSALEDLVLEGSMALWIVEKKTQKLALFRSENPLYVAQEENKIWFASEKWMLEKIGLKNIEELNEGQLIIYSDDGDKEEEYIISASYHSHRYYHSNKDWDYYDYSYEWSEEYLDFDKRFWH